MGLFSWLKTSEKAVDTATNLVKRGADGIDALFFTDEEKTKASMEMINLWVETQKVLRDENTAKSITRRILAVMIMGIFLLEGLIGIGLYGFRPDWSSMVLQVMEAKGVLVGSVAIFYFGYYGVKQVLGKK